MSNIYVMQRANGDVFAVDDHGRFGVPLFNSSSDAFLGPLPRDMARMISTVAVRQISSLTGIEDCVR